MMKKVMSSFFVLFVLAVSIRVFAQSPADLNENLDKDIQILKIINLFDLTKEEVKQAIPIFKAGQEQRNKNLTQIKEAMLTGKDYGTLLDTYAAALNETNAKITADFQAILTPEQKTKSQMILDLITEDEMQTLTGAALPMLGMITSRLSMLSELGIFTIKDETASQLLLPIAGMAMDMIGKIKNSIKEKIIGILTTQRAIELLEEMSQKIETESSLEKEQPAKTKTKEPTKKK